MMMHLKITLIKLIKRNLTMNRKIKINRKKAIQMETVYVLSKLNFTNTKRNPSDEDNTDHLSRHTVF